MTKGSACFSATAGWTKKMYLNLRWNTAGAPPAPSTKAILYFSATAEVGIVSALENGPTSRLTLSTVTRRSYWLTAVSARL